MARTKVAALPIPKQLRVGKRIIKVRREHSNAGVLGYCVGGKEICLYTHSHGRAVTVPQANETFWHELTHAILYEMGKPIKQEERFVRTFAKLLSQAVNTAKF